MLVIRAWIEEGRLRARITRTLDISSRDVVETVAASDDEIVTIVRAWLRELAESVTAR